MLCVIRIKGEVGLRKDIVDTLNRLRLRKKYSCIVLNPTKEQEGMVRKVKDFVAFGEINDEILKQLIERRGQLVDRKKKKPTTEDIIKALKEKKKIQELNLKPFFRLHPPRGGIESKKHFGVAKGVLGNHKEKINDLLMRML